MTRSEKRRIVARVTAIIAPIGALGFIPGYFIGGRDVSSALAGALIGFLIAGGMAAFETSWALGLLPRSWKEGRFLVVMIIKSLAWLFIIVVGLAVPLLTIEGLSGPELTQPEVWLSILVSFAFALLINFVSQVNRLLGRGVLVGLILGRYHQPREEERVFLLVDLRDSSRIAEQLGNLRYHAFLKRFIGDVSDKAIRFGAEIHRYIGDEIILTWERSAGLSDAKCVKAVLAIGNELRVLAPEYEAEFGIAPSFRAALHLGSVVTGEVGTIKHEIAYLGDTLNAAARIEEAGKEFDREFVASAAVMEGLTLPQGVITESLGQVALRGIESTMELVSIAETTESQGR